MPEGMELVFWCESYHRRQLLCARWGGADPPREKETFAPERLHGSFTYVHVFCELFAVFLSPFGILRDHEASTYGLFATDRDRPTTWCGIFHRNP